MKLQINSKEDLKHYLDINIRSFTNETWEYLYRKMKEYTIPTTYKKLTAMTNPSVIVKLNWWLSNSDKQETEYMHYRNFINDVLNEIRMGKRDYCYHVYQIADLLRFHPERLRTRLIDDYCIEVWLDK